MLFRSILIAELLDNILKEHPEIEEKLELMNQHLDMAQRENNEVFGIVWNLKNW